MEGSLIMGWLTVGCFLFAITDERSLALNAVLAVFLKRFAEDRTEGTDVAAAVAAAAVDKVSNGGQDDTAAAADSAAAEVTC